jgi:hypothetical protein
LIPLTCKSLWRFSEYQVGQRIEKRLQWQCWECLPGFVISSSEVQFMKEKWWRFGKRFSRYRQDIKKKKAEKWVARGESCLANGAAEEALKCSQKSLALNNNLNSAYFLMTHSLMPGDDYLTLISRFHNFLKPESYMEIGVAGGKSLELVNPQTKAIGIDPSPHEGIESHTRLYKMPSNDFFEAYNLFEELGTSRVPLAFIDGLHIFEQVLTDFINVERYGDRETIVLIHDCLPITRLVASRKRSTAFWCGDVWKIVITLLEHRPDLSIYVIPAPPSGLGVITNLDPNSTVLSERYESIVTEYQAKELEYDFLDFGTMETLKAKFNIVPNTWDYIVQNILHGT